jgi:hypothetical protein
MMLVAAGAVRAELKPLPTAGRGWAGDPLLWKFRAEGVRCALPGGNGMAVYEAAPLASNVTVEALFTPQAAARVGWAVASVAIVDDARNYWHLALVQTPPERGCKPMVELTEMRDGEWLAQFNLKVEIDEPGDRQWSFGQPCRLTLSLDKGGVTGTILAADGRTLLRKRHAFTAEAVRRGRPALRVAGFTGAFTEVRAEWSEPAAEAVTAKTFPPYAMANTVPAIKEQATGFFRVVQKPDGRWWAIDPNGCGVVLLGVDHVTFQGHWCEKLGYCPHGKKNEKKYADRAEWESETLGRLKTWGFTMLGAGCDAKLKHRGLVHTEFLNIGDHLAALGDEYDITPNERRPCSSFPNVFHPDFEAYCRHRVRQSCAPNRDDPWLFGYFIDNELAWWGRGGPETGLFDAVMKKGATHTAKVALKDFVAGRCDRQVEGLNAAFGTTLARFDDLLDLPALPHATPEARELKKAFLSYVAERYFSVTSKAIREVDPNHLVLGARFAGTGGADPAVWEVSGKYCDVVTFNCYPMADLDEGRVYTHFGKTGERVTEHFAKYYNYVKRPMLITEWSFPALDAGLPSVHGAGQRFRTQAERTAATSLFARTMLSLPFLLGYDYFMWVDEPALGISTPFPEDSNYGLINEDGAPYGQLTAMFEALHREAGAWRFKPEPEPVARPKTGPRPDAMAVAKRAGGTGAPPVIQGRVDPAAEAAFTREGDAFRASNGRLELSGRLGGGDMVGRVTLDGADKVYGRYNALLHTLDAGGQNRWTDARTVTAVAGRVTDGIAIIDVTSAFNAGPEGFEVTHRLLLPPGTPWFVSEIVSVMNTGAAPLRLRSLFFRLYSEFKDAPKAMPPNLWGLPVADCWMDGASGRFFGAVASRASDIRIDFWLDEGSRGAHPDARWELTDATAVEPGATYLPPEPVYVVCVAGAGGGEGWLTVAQKLRQTLE